MHLLEIIKLFISNEELLFEFIKAIKKIHKIEQCDDGSELIFFFLQLFKCFGKSISLNEKKNFFYIGLCLYRDIFENLVKTLYIRNGK